MKMQVYKIIWDKIKEVNKSLTSYKAIKATWKLNMTSL